MWLLLATTSSEETISVTQPNYERGQKLLYQLKDVNITNQSIVLASPFQLLLHGYLGTKVVFDSSGFLQVASLAGIVRV